MIISSPLAVKIPAMKLSGVNLQISLVQVLLGDYDAQQAANNLGRRWRPHRSPPQEEQRPCRYHRAQNFALVALVQLILKLVKSAGHSD